MLSLRMQTFYLSSVKKLTSLGWGGGGEEDVLHLPKNFKSNYRAGILMVCCCFTVKCRFYDVYLSNLKIF